MLQQLPVPGKYPSAWRPVFVHRWRHDGGFKLWNFFLIGEAKSFYKLLIIPLCYLDSFLLRQDQMLSNLGVVKFANGGLNPNRMTIEHCVDSTILPELIRDAFSSQNAHLEVKDFYRARVYLPNVRDSYTIGSLLQRLH